MTVVGHDLGVGTSTSGVDSPAAVGSSGKGPTRRRRFEFLYFAVRNPKLIIGLSLVFLFVLIAFIGPLFVKHSYTAFYLPFRPPSAQYWFGTNYFGNDVFAEFVYGLRESLFVGLLAGCGATVIGMTLGFIAGYKGGLVDEGLNVLTNVLLTLPTLVLLILVAGFLQHTSALTEALLIACTTWTWSMRAIRAQTFSLVSRDFVGLARLSGEKSRSIIVREIAPNMSSYLFLVFILLFGSSILTAAGLDFLGLGPPNGMSLGIMMEQATDWSALQLHLWWWFIPPGVAITSVVGGLYLANVGLDEVFNPKLRAL
jgi:peptide/nickel transport system permease protein